MLTQRDMAAGISAAHIALGPQFSVLGMAMVQQVVKAVIEAVDAERHPVAVAKDVLEEIFAPPHKAE